MPAIRSILAVLLCLHGVACSPNRLSWRSEVTGADLPAEVIAPAATGRTLPTVIYLKNLSIPRQGRDSDGLIIRRLTERGCLVVTLDYAHHPDAVSPKLNLDLLKLRRDIADRKQRSFLLDQPIDVDRLFIIPEGFTLTRDIEFARDGERVLAMDVIHPSNPAEQVPLLMEITCDNVNRMGSFSLLYCRDTLLEGAALAGFTAAMVDHPVRPPYKGIDDPMPEALERASAAVDRLRGLAAELGHSGRIGAIGFSRGGPFAAMLAGRGEVGAALVHGNRYDYLDLLPTDPMLPRFAKAWGSPEENPEAWRRHGAVAYLTDRPSPMYLSTSDTESSEYRHGLRRFAELLKARGVEHTYIESADGRGHTVTTDPVALEAIYAFFRKHLAD